MRLRDRETAHVTSPGIVTGTDVVELAIIKGGPQQHHMRLGAKDGEAASSVS